MIINGVTVVADPALAAEEIQTIVQEEIGLWQKSNKILGEIQLMLDGENVVISAKEKSPIRRVRRITGYLSNLENFNEAKQSECVSREIHM